jgi:2-oxoglutarate ferredoxin oxidoreductase subunit gamma
METSIVFSGFGGQGALFAGQVVTYAAMDSGLNTTWIPSYGPEMRGGTARCTVIISDGEEIGSPIVLKPDIALVFNLPSIDKLEPLMKPGGLMIANQSLINRDFEREDITGVFIPAQEIAEELGNHRMLNMVMLGALLEVKPILPVDAVKQSLADHIAERHKHTVPKNNEAMDKGAEFVRKMAVEKV